MEPNAALREEACRLIDLVDEGYRDRRHGYVFRQGYEQAIKELVGELRNTRIEHWGSVTRMRVAQLEGEGEHLETAGPRQACRDLLAYLDWAEEKG